MKPLCWRKALGRLPQLGATWELRFGANNRFRVFYRTELSKQTVYIQAIAVKVNNKLFIGNSEFEL